MNISLRPLNSTDLDAFFTWGQDQDVTKSLFWDAYQNKESAKTFLKEVAEAQQQANPDGEGGTDSVDEATAAATALTGEPPLTGGEPPNKSKN